MKKCEECAKKDAEIAGLKAAEPWVEVSRRNAEILELRHHAGEMQSQAKNAGNRNDELEQENVYLRKRVADLEELRKSGCDYCPHRDLEQELEAKLEEALGKGAICLEKLKEALNYVEKVTAELEAKQ